MFQSEESVCRPEMNSAVEKLSIIIIIIKPVAVMADSSQTTTGEGVRSFLNWCHTPSTAFRHLPPNSARFGYTTEGALFISAQLSTDAVSALQKVWVLITLRVSLSGTFLQTLPDLVTPLKGHSFLRAAVHRRGQRPPKGFGTDKTVEAT